MIEIGPLDPASDAAAALLAASDAYLGALYPAESNHLESVAGLQQTHVLFLGARVDGQVCGCGAVKILHDDGSYGELKRLFVTPAARGRGVARRLMAALEHHLRQQDIRLARLETGIHQPEALALYQRLGYTLRPPFGQYQPDPLSMFLERSLEDGGGS